MSATPCTDEQVTNSELVGQLFPRHPERRQLEETRRKQQARSDAQPILAAAGRFFYSKTSSGVG